MCRKVSKMDNRMKPAAPMIEKSIAAAERILCPLEVLRTKWPRCLSHLSMMKPKSNKTTEVVPMAMNKGFNSSAPTSDM